MEITALLKGWLVEHAQVDKTASDDTFREAMALALVKGTLTIDMLTELSAPPRPEPDVAEAVAGAVTETIEPLAREVTELRAKFAALETKEPPKDDELTKQVAALVATLNKPSEPKEPEDSKATSAAVLNPGSDDAPKPPTKADVITVDKQYSSTKSALYHTDDPNKGLEKGMPAMYGQHENSGGTHLESQSELEKAYCAAYFKIAANANNPRGLPLSRKMRVTDHDRDLFQYALRNSKWTGIVGQGSDDLAGSDQMDGPNVANGVKLNDLQMKALLDDTTSGGLEAAPIAFDQAVITTPLLHGELFPLVTVVPVSRGRRMEGFSLGNPTFTSGTAEGTSISLFSTASMVAAFDTTIFNAVGAIEIGNDFESDSPVNMGQQIVQLYGEAAKNWLDNQLANGDGTTELQGIFNASGITDVGNPAGGANAAPQPDDYISLAFNVAKQYRGKENNPVFVGNDTSYQRARAIAVGAADERRVFGHNVASYELLEWPYKVQNDIANTVAGFFAMKFYRLYRRLGLTVRVETGGKENALKNQTLIVVRMRWGGKLTLGGAGSYSDNWQT